MPNRAPRLRLSWIPMWSFHSQAMSPARRFGDEKYQAFVTRSAAHPLAAVIMNRKKRLRGTALLFVATTDDAGTNSAFMLLVADIQMCGCQEHATHRVAEFVRIPILRFRSEVSRLQLRLERTLS